MTGRDWTAVDRRMLFGGVALALLGLVLALTQLGLVSGEALAPWWPLALTAFGVFQLVSRSREAQRGGAWLVLLSAWLLVNTLRVGGLWWGSSWPLLPLLLGLFQIAWPEKSAGRFGGFILTGIGAWLLLATRHVLGLELATSWPLVLVFVGSAIALRALVQAVSGVARRRPS